MKRFSRIFLGGVLVTIGCGFFLYPNFREWNTQREVDQIIEVFDKTYSETIKQDFEQDDGNKNEANNSHDSQNNKDVSVDNNNAGDSADVNKTNEKEDSVSDKKNTEDASSKTPKNESDENDNLESSTASNTSDTGEVIENSVQTSNVPTARPYQSLYDEMVKYNNDLSTNGQNIVDAWSYEQQPLDISLMKDGSPVVGYIEIPDMQIRLPLMLGASPDNLEKGAAVLSETSLPIGGADTNCVIAGHRGWEGSAYFQYVENMKHGSKVYVTNPWETLVYECTDIKVIYPDDVNSILIQPGKDMITLFTCHPYRLGGGPYRYLVFCERVDTQKRISAEGQHVINPKVDENEPMSSMTIENIEDMKLEDINKEIDKKEQSEAKENLTDKSKETAKNETTAEIIVKDESGESQDDVPPAELISDDGNLIALEQTLRYFLPIAVIAASIIIVLLRSVKPKKKKKKKSRNKGKNKSKRRTKI